MTEVQTLIGQHVTLRPPQPADKAARLALGRDPEIVRMFGGDARSLTPLTEAEVDAWYENLLADNIAWSIDCDGHFIGEVRLHSSSVPDERASLAVGIFDPDRLGQGLGTEAVKLVLSHAFSELGLHRVEARVLAYNERAIACYEKCGFRREGVARQSALVGDEWHDDVIMGVLSHEATGE